MADISVTSSRVRPLNGAIVRRFDAGAALSVGDAVYVDSSGKVQKADADDQAQAQVQARGVVVAIGTEGRTTAAAGDPCDVVTHGPVELGTSGLTDGAAVYVSTRLPRPPLATLSTSSASP
jgi:hypothetical protein